MRRTATKTEITEVLTLPQTTAIEALLSGKNMVEAAAAAGVDRTTLYRWQKENFEFQAQLNQGRAALQQAYQLRLENLIDRALQTVEQAVGEGNVKAALEVLKGTGMFAGTLPGIGKTTVRALMREARQDENMEALLDAMN